MLDHRVGTYERTYGPGVPGLTINGDFLDKDTFLKLSNAQCDEQVQKSRKEWNG